MAAARPNPEAITWASWGFANTPHLAMEPILAQQGVRMSHVPYTGQAPAMQTVLAG